MIRLGNDQKKKIDFHMNITTLSRDKYFTHAKFTTWTLIKTHTSKSLLLELHSGKSLLHKLWLKYCHINLGQDIGWFKLSVIYIAVKLKTRH